MTELHTVTGTVWAVFGHRFAVAGADGRFLADLGPKGAEGLALAPGDTVTVSGARKPSEIEVSRLVLADGTTRTVAWPDKPGRSDHAPADAEVARAAARQAGYAPNGEPMRKPKHFEIPALKDGAAFTLHIALDGALRKAEPSEVEP